MSDSPSAFSAPPTSSSSLLSSFDAPDPSRKVAGSSRGLTKEEVAAAGVKFTYTGGKGGKKEESEEDERTENTTDTWSSSSQGEAKWAFDNASQEEADRVSVTIYKIEVVR